MIRIPFYLKSKAKTVMQSVVADKAVRDSVKVDVDSRGLVISLIDKSFFAPGSAWSAK